MIRSWPAAGNPDYELKLGRDWIFDPNVRAAAADYPYDGSGSDIGLMNYTRVGGSTVFYGGQWMRQTPADFRVRPLDGVADDWPIGYAELEPYYRRVERDFAVSGYDGDPAYPAGLRYGSPAVPLGVSGRKAARGFNELGWHWWPGSNAIATQTTSTMRACVGHGTCPTRMAQSLEGLGGRQPLAIRAGQRRSARHRRTRPWTSTGWWGRGRLALVVACRSPPRHLQTCIGSHLAQGALRSLQRLGLRGHRCRPSTSEAMRSCHAALVVERTVTATR